MAGALFKDIQAAPKVDRLKQAGTYSRLLQEAVGTALWILVASAINSGWSWGLAFVVIDLAFDGTSKNTIINFKALLKGHTDWLTFLITFLAHCLGAIAANAVAGPLGLAGDNATASLSFLGANGAFTLKFWEFWFSKEMIGLFLYTCFISRASGNDVPPAIWDVLMITVAFWLGGSSFIFFPARLFSTFGAFASAGAWATLICQFWAVTLALVFLEWVWKA